MARNIYHPITAIVSGNMTLNELKITADYSNQTLNPFSGAAENCGFYVYLTPVQRERGSVRSVLIGNSLHERGFKVLVKAAKRNNRKISEKLVDIIETVKGEVADLYSKQEYNKLVDFLKETIAKAA